GSTFVPGDCVDWYRVVVFGTLFARTRWEKALMIVIPLQVLGNVASIVIREK
ncbi:unnamed protein product, partial [Ilex paraguariensis]